MTYLAAALFFTVALLTALVAIHMTVRLNSREILLALKGELGATPRAQAAPSGASRQRAAF